MERVKTNLMTSAPLQSVIAAMPLPVLLVGASEKIVAGNRAAERLFGTDGTGRHYITALRQPALLDAIEATAQDGRVRQSRYLGSEGQRDTTWDVTVARVALDDGPGVLLSFEDVTAVEEAGQMRRDFVANVSHELRTPLTALLGFVETLKGAAREDPAARDKFLGIMELEAGRMARLVDDLLSLSRVEEEERVRPMTPVDLCALIDDSVAGLDVMARQAGLAIGWTRPSSPLHVPGDAGQLRQVLNNLIENAMKYGRGGEKVDVSLGPVQPEPALRGHGVRLSVRDYGEGIAPHHIARLTERFYRVDNHRSRAIGGTGLGLAIVKHIVNRHRGRLRVESQLGQGSTFTVILPLT